MSAVTAESLPPSEQPPDDAGPAFVARLLRPLLLPTLSLVVALAVGAVLIYVTDPSAGIEGTRAALAQLFKSSLGSRNALSETLVNTIPLLFAGLSVAIAFQAGLFNIGAFGQIILGTVFAGYVGFAFDLPGIVHVPLAVLAGFLGGALWGGLVGLLKARTGAHEVITTIMLNFVALRSVDWLLTTTPFQRAGRQDPISKVVADSARLPSFTGVRLNGSIVIAVLAIVAVWWLLYRSTLGYRIRAVGQNPSAARYAGMSVGGTWMLTMAIAGGLSGLAGTSNLLGVEYTFSSVFPNIGFDAIALALLGRARPFGVAGAALLFGALRAGAVGMQAATQTPIDIIVVVQGLIIAFVAAPVLIQTLFRLKQQDEGLQVTIGWGA